MTFEEEFPSLKKETTYETIYYADGVTGQDVPNECSESVNIITIQKHCLDKQIVKEAIMKTLTPCRECEEGCSLLDEYCQRCALLKELGLDNDNI